MKTKRCAWATNPKKAVAYLRVSTDREAQALGIQAQRTALESWAIRDGFEICEWFEEEVSGGASLDRRPVLLRAIAALGDHRAGLLVVQRLDRFSRDPLTAAMAELQAQRLGARVVSADGMGNGDDPGSRLMRDVGLAAARFERAMIAARTRAALAVKKARGECTGTPPYGWKTGADGKTLEAENGERETVRRLCSLREQGWPYRQIRDEARRLGITSRAGKPFTLRGIFDLTKDAQCRQLRDEAHSRTLRPDEKHLEPCARSSTPSPSPRRVCQLPSPVGSAMIRSEHAPLGTIRESSRDHTQGHQRC
jgi:DNA invertase Pin-like site-specific DNA recombinase